MANDETSAQQRLKKKDNAAQRRKAAEDADRQTAEAYASGSFLTDRQDEEKTVGEGAVFRTISRRQIALRELVMPMLIAVVPAGVTGGLYGLIPGNGQLSLLELAIPSIIIIALVALVGASRAISLPEA